MLHYLYCLKPAYRFDSGRALSCFSPAKVVSNA
jgi:hypothetical protein